MLFANDNTRKPREYLHDKLSEEHFKRRYQYRSFARAIHIKANYKLISVAYMFRSV